MTTPNQTFQIRLAKRLQPAFSLRGKIIYGYALAISLSVVGTLSGLLVGNYYQQRANQARAIASQEQKLLSSLQISILERRLVKELSPYVNDPEDFRQASQHVLEEVADVKTLLDQLQSLAQSSSLVDLKPRFQAYEQSVDRFYQKLDQVIQQIQTFTTQPEQASAAQQLIVDLAVTPEFAQYITFADELATLIETSKQQEARAEVALQQAEWLRMKIILGSILVSVVAAIALSLYTSQAIARPIESLTQTAKQVIHEADFSLRAPITTQDEVGSLAQSINQLIQWVTDYTQDLKTAQTQLIQTEKMSSLGQMVAGIAHEINNPINFIYGNLNHVQEYSEALIAALKIYQQHCTALPTDLQDQLKDGELEFAIEDLPRTITSMQVGADRIRQIVLSLRNFSRLDEAEIKQVDLHEGIENTLLILNHRLKRDIEVRKDYQEIPLVECYPAQINQVFMNVLSNAVDALLTMPDGTFREIVIATDRVAGDRVKVRIWNNGPYIPDPVKGKLFDPFFTTKPIGQGTGLGLAISYQIIQTHQGKIEVYSEPHQGAAFEIILPIGWQSVGSISKSDRLIA